MKLFGWFSKRGSTLAPSAEPVEPPLLAEQPLRLFSIDAPTKEAIGRITRRDHCNCLGFRAKRGTRQIPELHTEEQDITSAGWLKALELTRSFPARDDTLTPSAHIPWDEWMGVITLPKEIAELKSVRTIHLYGSHLRRLPPEIGRMSALQELDVYTSYGLHWLPYEILRCKNLKSSRMSTRALYGNRNTGLPFPRLRSPQSILTPATCSVCDQPFGDSTPRLFWTTQQVGTDHVPLLVHSCSEACTAAIPDAPTHYFPRPHKGGGGVGMPTTMRY